MPPCKVTIPGPGGAGRQPGRRAGKGVGGVGSRAGSLAGLSLEGAPASGWIANVRGGRQLRLGTAFFLGSPGVNGGGETVSAFARMVGAAAGGDAPFPPTLPPLSASHATCPGN